MLYRQSQHLQTLQVKEMADVRLPYHVRDRPIIPTVNLMTLTTRRTRLWLIVTAKSSQGDYSHEESLYEPPTACIAT